MTDADRPDGLDAWLRELCAELGLPDELVQQRDLLLDVAREAAHGVMRPAAPLTTFLVGFAAGRAAEPPADAVTAAARTASGLARARGDEAAE